MSSNESPETNAQQSREDSLGGTKDERASEDERPGTSAQSAEVAGNVAPTGECHDIQGGQGRMTTDDQTLEPGNVTRLDSSHADYMKLDPAAVPSPGKSTSPVAKALTDGTKPHHPVMGAETAVASEKFDNQDKIHEFPHEDQSYVDSYGLLQVATLTQSSCPEVSVPFVPLDAAQSMLLAPENGLMAEIPFLEPALSIVEPEAPRIQAFAKLEFDDGQFYMNTYSVELGRDIRAARLAFQRDLEASQHGDVKAKRRSSDGEDVSQTPSKLKGEGSSRLAGSVVSETGGIMGVDMQDRDPRRKKKSKISKSTSSSSQYLSRKNSMNIPSAQTDYQSLAMASLSESTVGAHPVDPLSLLPSPDECPLIPIHPPAVAVDSAAGHKGISRKHVRIAFNFDKHLFEVEIKGKNGAFVDEQWYAPGEVRPLKSGSYIQIGGVGVRFVLPDVALGETGAETIGGSDPAQGGKMSFEFEDGRGESIVLDDSSEDEVSVVEDLMSGEEEGEDNDEDEEEEEEEEEEGLRQNAEGELAEGNSVDGQSESEGDRLAVGKQEEPVENEPSPEPPPPPPPPARRKGPGRPPKNGVISKREQALIARKAREDAKKIAQTQASPPSKTLKDKSRKIKTETLLEATPPPKPEKRKYTKRKKAEPQTEGVAEQSQATGGTSQADGHTTETMAPPKPPKEKKPPKPPRSPSPVFDESQMTPEQLAKPQSSYVVLIHEALTNSKTGAMSLPQIYRAIERRYPFYKLRVTTTGWQSSVRHNLSQHHAFRKVERDGKGWMWGLVPGVSIEKEKKRRPSPPPPPPQHYLQQGPSVLPSLHYPGMPNGQGYGQHSMPPHLHGPYHPIPPGPGSTHPPFHPPAPPTSIHSLPPPLLTAQRDDSSYQSPYQPPPQSQAPALPQPQPQSPPQSQSQIQQSQQSQHQYQHQHQHQHQHQPQHQHQHQPQHQPQPQPQVNNHTQSQTYPPPTSSHSGANGFYANTRLSQAPPQQLNYQARTTPPNQPRPTAPQQQTYTAAPTQRSASVGQDVLQAVGKFKNALISSMPDKVRGEVIVTSAINRTLGLQNSSTVLGKEDPQEKAIMKALAGMLGNLSKKNEAAAAAANAARQPSSGPPQPPPHGQHLSPGLNGQPPPAPPQQQNQQQQQQQQQQPQPQPPSQPQQQPYPQSSRPPPQAQQGAQAQLLQLLQQIGNRNTASPSSQQRPPQPSASPVPADLTQANGASRPSTSPVPAPSLVENSQPPTLPNGASAAVKEEPAGVAASVQDAAPSADAVVDLKRPLDKLEGSPDAELPEAKRVAAG